MIAAVYIREVENIRLLAAFAKSILSTLRYWVCATDTNLPINITDLFPSHLIDFCPIYPGNIFLSYIGQDYPENIYVSLLTNPFTTLTLSINWNGSDMQFSGWLAHYMKTIFVEGGGSSIRYAVKHMHIYWPNPRLLYTSGFPRHTIHTHSQPIGRADKYQEQKRQ